MGGVAHLEADGLPSNTRGESCDCSQPAALVAQKALPPQAEMNQVIELLGIIVRRAFLARDIANPNPVQVAEPPRLC